MVGDPIVPFIKLKRKMGKISSRSPYLNHKPKGTHTKHNQNETTVGGRDGKVEYKI